MLINNFHSIYAQDAKPQKKSSIDSPINYKADDSTKMDFNTQVIYLYGNASVEYGDVSITANYIEFRYGENIVLAKYSLDSTGNKIGKPVFKEGEETYEMDEIHYNTSTKKGVIFNVVTAQAEGFLHSEKIKKQDNNHIHVYKGKYTTCDKPENPHYHFRLSRAVVIPDDKIVSGPLYLRVGKFPTPLGLPFGYFPNKKGGSSGIIIPEFGEVQQYGFALTNGGYYHKVNEQLDLQFFGSIFSKGSWGTGLLARYNTRYKYVGEAQVTYNLFKTGFKDTPEYSQNSEYSVYWNHRQDASLRPGTSFSTNVNISSRDNFKNSINLDANNYLSNTFQSNIAYAKMWNGKPYNLSVNLRHSQNNISKIVNATLPEATFNVNRFYPLASLRKVKTSNKKFYENIGVTWSTVAKNDITIADSLIDLNNLGLMGNNLRNGLRNNLAVNAPLKIFNNITFNAGANFTDRWYLQTIEKNWNNETNSVSTDTVSGFSRNWDYNLNASLTTTIYGTYGFAGFLKGDKQAKVRHVMSPNISFVYRPDFNSDKSYTDQNTNTVNYYSPYSIGIFGQAPTGESGAINFNLVNSLELKVKDVKNSEDKEVFKKIKILENFTVGSSYDIARDSMNFSNINIAGRTTLFNILSFNFSGSIDPYTYREGVRINVLQLKEDGSIGTLTFGNAAIGFNLRSKSEAAKRVWAPIWNANISYSLDYRRNISTFLDTAIITNNIRFDGNIDVNKNWRLGLTTSYDAIAKDLAFTQLNIYRDLHCWEAAFEWVPFGFQKRYMIRINVKASVLQDLKLERRRNIYNSSFL
jgi:lipopolysaccharide assembly outer membrane protein LptD (OstA)